MGMSAIGTLVLFFLNGVAITKLSDKALLYLTGATVAELAGMMFRFSDGFSQSTESTC